VVRHRLFSMGAAALVALVLLLPLTASGDSAETQLLRVSTAAADDGSLRITLDFNKRTPEARVIRSDDTHVHVVVFNTTIARDVHPDVLRYGELAAGNFADFAGIGMRLDLRLRDRVTIRTEAQGNTLVVHIPARKSDHEAATARAAATAPAPAAVAMAAQAGPPRSDSITALVKLSYADVSEVAGALVRGAVVPSNDYFTAVSPFAPPTPPPNSGNSSAATNTVPSYVTIAPAALLPKETPQGVRFDEHVAVDRRLNAVILSGTRAEVDAYKALVAQLDVPSTSVLLDAQIVELTTTGAKDLGIDFSPSGSLTTATVASGSFGQPNFKFNIGAAVSALAQRGQAKILARPRIISLNNRPAAILSGEAVPIFTSIVIGSGSSAFVQNQVQYINVGVSLQILPRIAEDGRVTTQIFCEVSSIIDFEQNTPRIAVRQELTSAIVNDSESLIVGGLLQETEIRSLKKIPGLGDIPLLGGFFRDSSGSSQNTNLYVVITPHILTNGATTASFDLPPLPMATIPPADPSLVPGPLSTPPPGSYRGGPPPPGYQGGPAPSR
jgi:general secretion pathway protein D